MKPPWIKVHADVSEKCQRTVDIFAAHGLNTMCKSSSCPNMGECFTQKTATFLLMGEVCSRSCTFCAFSHGIPLLPDSDEPERVAEAAQRLGLRYLVLTSVTRDDLMDGGAKHFLRTIGRVRELLPSCRIEALVPDFKGDETAIRGVAMASVDIFAHHLETVPSLFSETRPGASYLRSLKILERARLLRPEIPVKSGLMLGLGEDLEEVVHVMRDLREVGCDILTIGQYHQSSVNQLPVERYVTADEFVELKRIAFRLGFLAVEAGPAVRSSYRAGQAMTTIARETPVSLGRPI